MATHPTPHKIDPKGATGPATREDAGATGATGATGGAQSVDRSPEGQRPGGGMVGGSGTRSDAAHGGTSVRSQLASDRAKRIEEHDAKRNEAVELAVKDLDAAEQAMQATEAKRAEAFAALKVAEAAAEDARQLYREAAAAHFTASRMSFSPLPDEPAVPQPAVLS
jgi:hypothetical protein